LVAWVRRELDQLGIPPLKRFGQHFLIDKRVREEILEQSKLSRDDIVLEVGPGLGFLTVELAAKAGRVIAVEKDRTLAKYLAKRLAGYRNLTIIEGDVLRVEIPQYTKMVASPPYNISSKLVLMILEGKFELATLLLQNEFAERLTARPGTAEYGRLTVMVQCRAHANVISKVPRTAFNPKPRVDSALVTITPSGKASQANDWRLFSDLVRFLFTQRRRRLVGVLSQYLTGRFPDYHTGMMREITIPEKRVFEVGPEELVNLSNEIAATYARLGRGTTGN